MNLEYECKSDMISINVIRHNSNKLFTRSIGGDYSFTNFKSYDKHKNLITALVEYNIPFYIDYMIGDRIITFKDGEFKKLIEDDIDNFRFFNETNINDLKSIILMESL